jgi:hypothetical protein
MIGRSLRAADGTLPAYTFLKPSFGSSGNSRKTEHVLDKLELHADHTLERVSTNCAFESLNAGYHSYNQVVTAISVIVTLVLFHFSADVFQACP